MQKQTGTQSFHSFFFFFFGPTDRPTITRDGAMGKETFYGHGLKLPVDTA